MRRILVIAVAALAMFIPAAVASAGVKPVSSNLAKSSGTQYGDSIGVDWQFSGRPGQYPRLHVDLVCYDEAGTIVYGSSIYLDGYGVPTVYPGFGTVFFPTAPPAIYSPWDYSPGDVSCKSTLLNWTNKGQPVVHKVIEFSLSDPRV